MRVLFGLGPDEDTARRFSLLKIEFDHWIAARSNPHFSKFTFNLGALEENRKSKKQEVLFDDQNVIAMNYDRVQWMLDDILNLEIDLIISDGDIFTLHLGKSLGIETWSCTPYHLLDSVNYKLPLNIGYHQRRMLKKIKPDKKIIYSALGQFWPEENDTKFCMPKISPKTSNPWLKFVPSASHAVGSELCLCRPTALYGEEEEAVITAKLAEKIGCAVDISGKPSANKLNEKKSALQNLKILPKTKIPTLEELIHDHFRHR